jgi:hypothetical protein
MTLTTPKQAVEQFIEIWANPYETDLKCLKAFKKLKVRLHDAKSEAFNQSPD